MHQGGCSFKHFALSSISLLFCLEFYVGFEALLFEIMQLPLLLLFFFFTRKYKYFLRDMFGKKNKNQINSLKKIILEIDNSFN